MSPCLPPVVSLDQSVVSSMVISPNCVLLDTSPDLPDAEPMFEVSPDTSGFLMRPSGAVVQPPVMTRLHHPANGRWTPDVEIGVIRVTSG